MPRVPGSCIKPGDTGWISEADTFCKIAGHAACQQLPISWQRTKGKGEREGEGGLGFIYMYILAAPDQSVVTCATGLFANTILDNHDWAGGRRREKGIGRDDWV